MINKRRLIFQGDVSKMKLVSEKAKICKFTQIHKIGDASLENESYCEHSDRNFRDCEKKKRCLQL